MADRIEREIEEILRKIDNFVPEAPRRHVRRAGQPFAAAQGWFSRRLARVSMNQIMAWSLVLTIVAFLFLQEMPGGSWLMIGGLIIFVTAFVFSRRGGGRPPLEKRWRGEPIDLSGPSLLNRIKGWVKGRRRR